MHQYESLEDMERIARAQVAGDFGAQLELCDELMLWLNHSTARCSGFKSDRGPLFVEGVMLAQAFNSMRRAREDAAAGYSPQCMATTRVAFELAVALMWLRKHPDKVELWSWALFAEVARPAGRVPSVDTMLTEFAEFGSVLTEAYDAFSKFAHPRGAGLRLGMQYDGAEVTVTYGPYVNPSDLRLNFFGMIETYILLMESAQHWQARILGAPSEEDAKTAKPLIERASAYLDSVAEAVAAEAAGVKEAASHA